VALSENQQKQRRRLSHPLSGADLITLMSVLFDNGGVSPGSLPQATLAIVASLLRLPFTVADGLWVMVKRTEIEPIAPPIFILGHWRSGTTHLYNIMSRAPHFHTVSPFATALPWDFLSLTRFLGRVLSKALPEGRYIDNVPVEPDSPQEDEIGLANMSPVSFYHGLYFPKRFHENFERGIFFGGLDKEEIAAWQQRLKYYYLKLQLEKPEARLLIKNPVYTARVKELLKLWPEAKFIHIHRNPYKIFFSMRNFYDKLLDQFALQKPPHIDFDEHILESYARMMRALEADSAGLPAEQFFEMRFEDLQAQPMEQISRIYSQLGLTGYEAVRSEYLNYLDSVSDYQKNVYRYPTAETARVGAAWGHFIEKWGYSVPPTEGP
jgi:hypothetical protein